MSLSNDFPVELWMRVLDFVETDDYARPVRVERYATALQSIVPGGSDSGNNAVEEKAVEELSLFERRAWKTTRPFYAINRNSRAAAIKMRLSCKLMLACQKPIVWTQPRLQVFQVPLQPLKALMKSGNTGVIHLCDLLAPHTASGYASRLQVIREARRNTWWSLLRRNCRTKLAALRHVVLLAPDTDGSHSRPDWIWDTVNAMEDVEEGIKRGWRDGGVQDGEVEVWF